MKYVNLFTANLEGKQLRSEKSESKKAVNASLADFAKAIDAAFTQVIKSENRRARNVANAAKGKFKTALEVVVSCFPYQTKDGVLCTKHTEKDSDGNVTGKTWQPKKLTAAAARGIVRDSLKNFIDNVGQPVVTYVEVGANVA